MPSVTFIPQGLKAEFPAGYDLIDAARQAGIEIAASCGGKGTCGQCLVRVVSGEVDSDISGLLTESAANDGYVLACRTRLSHADVTIEIQDQDTGGQGRFIETEESDWLFRQTLWPENQNPNPVTAKLCLTVPEPRLGDGLSDLDRLSREIHSHLGDVEIQYSLSVIRRLADLLRQEEKSIVATLFRLDQTCHVIAIEAAECPAPHYGIAVDLGTTTIAVELINLDRATVLSAQTAYNQQIACGLDVISRINYAKNARRLEELRIRALDTINTLVQILCEKHDIDPEMIINTVIAGNTTMIHLLLGLNPEFIRIEPYIPVIKETPFLRADEVGLDVLSGSPVYFAPHVGSYVGGDITSGILCTDLAGDTEEICLFLDIGTNGEIVLGNRDFLMTCACSAGPAFEGGGIDFGMRASSGAVESVTIDAETGFASPQTIGECPPKGICGSGMISLLAGLFRTGWIDAAGKLNRTKPSPAIEIDGRRASYILVPAGDSETGQTIRISETDFENLIRAKAAIFSAIALMLEMVELRFEDISKIIIAGGFGRFLDIDAAICIGLIPDLPRDRFHFIGNASLVGAFLVLVSQDYRKRQIELARHMTYLELNTSPDYMNQYTGALFLPHTDSTLFPSVMITPHESSGRSKFYE